MSIRPFKNQQGQVAIIVAICILLLIMIVGLVVDLGYLYTRKTELQNAADAAALAGAKELDGTTAGINSAVSQAKNLALANSVDFGGNSITIEDAQIEFGPNPDGPWSNVAASQADPGGKRFIKVDTSGIGLSTVQTWFMAVAGPSFEETTTYGRAVAGPYVTDVAPIGVCAVDKTRHEYGFIRGVTYNIPQLNPLVLQPDVMWINPVNAPPDTCAEVEPQWNSRAKMAAFVCTGTTLSVREVPGEVFVNTGQISALEKELNSRFDDYQGSKCNVATAPPDSNVQSYPYDGLPRDWMQPGANTLPTQQGISIVNRQPVDKTVDKNTQVVRPQGAQPAQYGVLWTHTPEKNYATGNNHTLSDWLSLYGLDADQTAGGYPSTGTPYSQPKGSKYNPSTSNPPNNPPGEGGRRNLNVVIIDCSVPEVNQVGPGNKCAALPTLAVGKFFMPVPADLPHSLYLEFTGLSYPSPLPVDIRLYR